MIWGSAQDDVDEELRRTIAQLDRVLHDRGVASAMIAHDARNLLLRIMGELSVVRPQLTGDDAASVDRALDAVRQLGRMCQNFVDLNQGRLRSDLVARPAPTNLEAWLRRLLRREQARARELGIELDVALALATPVYTTDAVLLERVVLNLLDNAYREAPRQSTVTLTLRSENDACFTVTVEDRGKGIPPEAQARLFKLFKRGAEGHTGTGLGLAFCGLAARALGGRIACEAPPDGGARFRLDVPNARG